MGKRIAREASGVNPGALLPRMAQGGEAVCGPRPCRMVRHCADQTVSEAPRCGAQCWNYGGGNGWRAI